jgi:hypothetical protein
LARDHATQPLNSDVDRQMEAKVDADEDRHYGVMCFDCGVWYPESWEVNEHIARDHYGQSEYDDE